MATDWAELNGGDDDDAALRRAIAMSLGQVPPPEEEEESGSPAHIDRPNNASQSGNPPVKADSSVANSMAALGLDRKQMEEERLARSRKRKAEAEAQAEEAGSASDTFRPDAHGPPSQRPRLLGGPATRLTQPSAQMTAPSLNSMSRSVHRRPTAVPKASPSGRLPYPRGAVLRTWARGSPREDSITIEQVLQKDDLELAVLSSFQWDEDWLMTKLDMRRTKVLLIAYAKDDTKKAEMRNNVPQDLIRFVFPPMDSVSGCMHSKLQLLKYKDSLRIVVPTGNLVAYDWGETGTMENMVFLIDLPMIQDPVRQATTLTPFGEELCFFLQAQGVDDKMISSLRKYDFSETSRYGFIHTIAGSHSEPDLWQRTGYCGLGRTVTGLGLDSADDVELDYICSSIGAVKLDLLTALYNASQGDSGIKEFDARTRRSKKSKDTTASACDQIDLKRVRVYFPSRDTVLRSQGGSNAIQSAGTIRFQSKWWNATSFPRQVLRDCRNVHSGILMHSKMIFVRHKSGSRGWAYVGSHNLSESAWGRLVKDRNGRPKFNARNWECGVIVLATTSPSSGTRGTRGAAEDFEVFRGSVPVPMELPALPYQGDERQPWFADEV